MITSDYVARWVQSKEPEARLFESTVYGFRIMARINGLPGNRALQGPVVWVSPGEDCPYGVGFWSNGWDMDLFRPHVDPVEHLVEAAREATQHERAFWDKRDQDAYYHEPSWLAVLEEALKLYDDSRHHPPN